MLQICGNNPLYSILSEVCGLIPKMIATFEPPDFLDDGVNHYQGPEIVEGFDRVFIWKAAV